MELKIYSQGGTLRTVVSPSDNSTHQKGVMQDNVLSLSFSLPEFVRLEVNDYVDFGGERFTLLNEYRPQQKSTIEYQYDVRFYGIESELKKALVLKMVDGDNDPSFALNDSPRVHLQLIADNINRIKGTQNWTVGQVITSPNQNVEYDCTYCYDALNKLAEVFGTEWWIEGNTINLSRCEHGDLLELGYGHGLTNLSKEENETAPFFTRLYPIGSTRNIDKEKYGSARLHLPGGARYVEQNTHLGIVEYAEEETFSGIYPRRVGQVGIVRSESRQIEGVARTIYYFTDPGLTFDPNDYEIAGLVKHVKFESGSLNGNDFEVNFNSQTKEFEIINQYPYDNMQLPGGAMIPKTGDDYVLWNITMPDEYYGLAEQELAEAVDAFLAQYSIDTAVYKGPTDYIDIDERGIVLTLGRRVRLLSEEYFTAGYRESRITAITRKVNNPSEADIECSYAVSPGRVANLENNVVEIQAAIKEQLSKELQVLKSYDSADPTEYNVFSSIRARRESLSRRFPDTAEGFKQFLDGASFGEFAGGITGTGGVIYDDGAAELKSLVLRRFLEVPELRYNRVEVIVGDRWRAPGGGLIESVDTVSRIVTLKLEDGELGNVAAGDICMGIFHSHTAADNSADDYDDSKGNRRFAGFFTVYFSIVEVIGDNRGQFRYQVRPISDAYPKQFHPCEAMNFIAYGSFTDDTRRTSVYETRTYQRYLTGVNGWEFGRDNIAAQFGDLANLAIHGLNMAGYSAYLNNVYTTGVINQISQDGQTTAPIPFNKGVWAAGHYAYYDYVTHNGSLWLCTNTAGTDAEPSSEASDWLEWVQKGQDGETDVTPCGPWESSKTPYRKNSIVTLGRASFMARKDTATPPVGLIKSGDHYLTSGGGYIMRGPVDMFVNTEDWIMISPPPVDGKPGEPGTPGMQGQQGLQGMIVRVTEWSENIEYHNDEMLEDTVRYLDVVVITSGATQSAYQCKTTHTSTAATAPGNTTYWQPFNSTVPIYTPLLLAKNAVIRFMQGQEIVVQDDAGNIVGGLSGKKVGDRIYPIYIGAVAPANAPFRVDQYGKVYASNAEITGIINATSGELKNVTIISNSTGTRLEIDKYGQMNLYDQNGKKVGVWSWTDGYATLDQISYSGDTQVSRTQLTAYGLACVIGSQATTSVSNRLYMNGDMIQLTKPNGMFKVHVGTNLFVTMSNLPDSQFISLYPSGTIYREGNNLKIKL